MPFGNGSTVNNSHGDYSGQWAELGVIGTLGTADLGGTALTLPFSVDAATGAAWGKEIGTPSTLPVSLQGSVDNNAVSIGTVPTAIPTSSLTSRRTFLGYNVGSSTVYIGGTNVATSGSKLGIPIVGTSFTPSIDLGTAILYGIVSGTGGTIVALEVS